MPWPLQHPGSLVAAACLECCALPRAQGGTRPGGQILNLGGGSDNPGPNGGGNTVRTFDPCTDNTCDIVEARPLTNALSAWRPHCELGPGSLKGRTLS